ncbi:MAG: hypothetical protein U0350_46640 [Caldilineaceae bacterium]
MKLIGRILLILAAALVVVGATIGLSRTSVGGRLFAGRERFGERRLGGSTGDFNNGNFAQRNLGAANGPNNGFNNAPPSQTGATALGQQRFNRDNFRGGFDRGGRGGASLFGLTEVIRNLGIMSIVVAIVVLGSRLVGGRRRVPVAH